MSPSKPGTTTGTKMGIGAVALSVLFLIGCAAVIGHRMAIPTKGITYQISGLAGGVLLLLFSIHCFREGAREELERKQRLDRERLRTCRSAEADRLATDERYREGARTDAAASDRGR